jgi:hypothetical protein
VYLPDSPILVAQTHPKAMNTATRLLLCIAICFSFNAYSQTDTSSFNLGRIKLKKDFTQSITIKGEELERMPFTDLYEAINAWSYGYYTNKGSIVYVIDGIIVNDINAWSVYDIKEVTLVQNALVQVNGAIRQQQLAVITTRKGGTGQQGITVAGQSYLVKTTQVTAVPSSTSSEKNFYHQYHVSAWKNDKNLQFGLSANYLRDVVPAMKESKVKTITPNNYDRFRINGWLTARLGHAHELSLRINVVPQVHDNERGYTEQTPAYDYSAHNKYRNKQTIFNPSVSFKSTLAQGFSNEFTASYGFSKAKGNGESVVTYTNPTSEYKQFINSSNTTKQVLLMDQVSYHTSLGNKWSVEPAVNFTFRYLDYKTVANQATFTSGNVTTISQYTTRQEGRLFLLTPSINLSYQNSFNVQGGLLANLSKTYGQKVKKTFPFVTTSVDVLRLARPSNPTSLKFFGSFAQAANAGDVTLSFADYNSSAVFTGGFGAGVLLPTGIDPDKSFHTWQAGTRLGVLNDLVSVNYLFERRNFTTEMYVPMAIGTGITYRLVYPDLNSNSHHLSINATVLNKKALYWRTGINATSLKSKSKDSISFYAIHTVLGDIDSDKASWTGGWVNRFSWKKFSAGVDLVYYFNPDQIPSMPGNSKINAVSLSNVYVGYLLNLKGTKGLELYADCRNLAQDKDFKITGTRKYYGLGVKTNL